MTGETVRVVRADGQAPYPQGCAHGVGRGANCADNATTCCGQQLWTPKKSLRATGAEVASLRRSDVSSDVEYGNFSPGVRTTHSKRTATVR